MRAREGGRGEEMKRYLLELQRCMLRFRETGNEKLEVTSEMLDTVSPNSSILGQTSSVVSLHCHMAPCMLLYSSPVLTASVHPHPLLRWRATRSS